MTHKFGHDSARAITDYIVRERADLGIKAVDWTTPLLESGILDSVFLVQLVTFLEEQFCVRIQQSEVTPENFESVETINRLVQSKLASQPD